jgi:signal transduction histidine kinase
MNIEHIHQTVEQFYQSIQIGDEEIVLITYLTLLYQAQQVIHEKIVILQQLSPSLNKGNSVNIYDLGVSSEIIKYISNTTDNEAREITGFIRNIDAQNLLLWHQKNWNNPKLTHTEVLQSVAGSLRTIMTAIYGHIELILRFTPVDRPSEHVLSEIHSVVDTIRNTRTRLSAYLELHGRPTQPY